MIPAEVPNWVAAIEMMVILTLKLLWGGDLMVTGIALPRPWWHVFVRAGSFWLGAHFGWESLFLYGALAFVFMSDPQGGVPTWFAAAMAVMVVFTVFAWLSMTFTLIADEEEGDGDA